MVSMRWFPSFVLAASLALAAFGAAGGGSGAGWSARDDGGVLGWKGALVVRP